MTSTTKLLLALSAATLGVVVWAIRKKSRVGSLGRINYADVKDPKADTIQEGPPARIGQGPAL